MQNNLISGCFFFNRVLLKTLFFTSLIAFFFAFIFSLNFNLLLFNILKLKQTVFFYQHIVNDFVYNIKKS